MLTRWDPFRDMLSIRRQMDRMMDDMLGGEDQPTRQGSFVLPLDVTENDEEYTVKASLPGVKPDDVDVTYRNGMLTIRGETSQEREVEREQYHLRERSYGTFSRTINLPGQVNADQIDASFDNGVLTLKLPKTEEVKPKRIQVRGQGEKMIEGKFDHSKER